MAIGSIARAARLARYVHETIKLNHTRKGVLKEIEGKVATISDLLDRIEPQSVILPNDDRFVKKTIRALNELRDAVHQVTIMTWMGYLVMCKECQRKLMERVDDVTFCLIALQTVQISEMHKKLCEELCPDWSRAPKEKITVGKPLVVGSAKEGLQPLCGDTSKSQSQCTNSMTSVCVHNFFKSISSTTRVQRGENLIGEVPNGTFGTAVVLSSDGSRMAIGGPSAYNDATGQVRVYDRSDMGWIQVGGTLIGEGRKCPWGSSRFGSSLAMSSDGHRLAIGEPEHRGKFELGTTGKVGKVGKVRVFELSGDTWTQVGGTLLGYVGSSEFALALSSNGNRLAIGVPDEAEGYVRVFEWTSSIWNQMGETLACSESDEYYGMAVGLSSSGSRLAIGGTGHWHSQSDSSTGYVQVFDWTGSAWIQVGQSLLGDVEMEAFGQAVALSSNGDRLAIGAQKRKSRIGTVRIYDWTGNTWKPVGEDLTDNIPWGYFGTAVALSSIGNRLAVGAPCENVGRPIVPNGRVLVYDWTGTRWDQVGADFVGEEKEDCFGVAVALSSNGSRLAVGGPRNDSCSGMKAGYVKVFDLDYPTSSS